MARALGVLVATLMVWGSAAQAEEHGRWQQLENNPSCSVWNHNPHPRSAVTWSGACVNGKAQGRGAQDWRYLEDEEWKAEKYTGVMKDGKYQGRGVLVTADGDSCEGDWREGRLLGMGKGRVSGQLKKCYDDGGTPDALCATFVGDWEGPSGKPGQNDQLNGQYSTKALIWV